MLILKKLKYNIYYYIYYLFNKYIIITMIDFDFFDDINLSYNDKFKKYCDIFINNSDEINNNHQIYKYLSFFNQNEIDILYNMYNLNINKYMFFRYLPNLHLIEKYFDKNKTDSNAFHGITKNINISDIERKNLVKNILSKKYL